MRKVTSFLDIPVISNKDTKVLGTISAVLCEKRLKSVEYFVFQNLYQENSEKLVFRSRNAILKNNDCILLSKNLCIQKLSDVIENLVYFPIGENVYENGVNVGTILDLTFQDTRKNTLALITDKGEIPINKIASVSDNGIVLFRKGKKKDDNVVIEKPKEDFSVEMFEKDDSQKIPTRIICNFRFLLNRVLTQNIYNFEHQLILKKGTLITIDDVMIAHKNNKLIDLTLFSKP